MRGMAPIRTHKLETVFLDALAETCNVSRACKAAGVGRMTVYEWREADPEFAARDLPPAGPAIITRVHRFDIRAAPPAQVRRVGRFHLAGTPGALVPVFGSQGMTAA